MESKNRSCSNYRATSNPSLGCLYTVSMKSQQDIPRMGLCWLVLRQIWGLTQITPPLTMYQPFTIRHAQYAIFWQWSPRYQNPIHLPPWIIQHSTAACPTMSPSKFRFSWVFHQLELGLWHQWSISHDGHSRVFSTVSLSFWCYYTLWNSPQNGVSEHHFPIEYGHFGLHSQ